MNATYEYPFSFPRWLMVVPLAMLVTAALLAVMARLIFTDIQAPEESHTVPVKDLSYNETIIETFPSIKPIEKPTSEPIPNAPPQNDPERGNLTVANVNIDTTFIRDEAVGIDFSGMPVPQFLVSPTYPSRAITRGIEGYVDVRFDISAIGNAENAQVMHAEPENIFDRAAVAAVQRWRYQPKMVDGNARTYPGMTRRIVFKMED